jgi:hypothetical protein
MPVTVASPSANQSLARKQLLAAVAITLVLVFIPFAEVLTYPLRIFVTFLHEAGHAVAALVSFGRVDHIEVFANGAGLTFSAGGSRLLIASAGYVGSTVAAAAILIALRFLPARAVLFGLGLALATITAVWVRNLFGLFAGVGIAVGLGATALYAQPRWAQLGVAFLAVQAGMNALFDLRTLFHLTRVGHAHNDAANLARYTGLPPAFWAVLWGLVSLAILWFALRSFRSPTVTPARRV